jgi:hypothetical protein
LTVKSIGSYDYNRGMLLGEVNHLFDALGEKPIVCSHHLAVLTLRRDLPKSDVMVRDHTDEGFVVVDSDTCISTGVLFSDAEGSVCAAVVDDCVIPVCVGLGQHAFDALAKIAFVVVDWRHHTDERVLVKYHRLATGASSS